MEKWNDQSFIIIIMKTFVGLGSQAELIIITIGKWKFYKSQKSHLYVVCWLYPD